MAYKQIRRRTQRELGQTEGATPEVSHAPEVSQIQTDRDLMTADDALALQDIVGNRATGQLMGAASPPAPPRTGYVQPKPIPPQPQRPGGSPDAPAYAHLRRKLAIQPKLTVDPAEQAADQVASQVASQPTDVQRAEQDDDMQLKPQIQRASWDGSFDTNADFESQVNQQSGGGKPLPSDVRADLEPKFGADFSGVKIHADANAAQLSQDVGAQAFTHGNDIYFNQGKYNPESSSGKHLLAHELTHTVQQGGSGVSRQVIQRWPGKKKNKEKDKNKKETVEKKAEAPKVESPNLELQDSIEYERRLGFYAYNHSKANYATAGMLDKMIGALIGEFDEKRQEHQEALVKTFGRAKVENSGNVGTDFNTVWTALREGNLRERMTALMNAMFGPFKTMITEGMTNKTWTKLNDSGFDTDKLKRRKRQLAWNPGAKDLYRDPGNPLDRKKFGNYQLTGTTRTATPENERGSKRTVGDLESGKFKAGLSEREKALMFAGRENEDLSGENLKWQEGGTYWKVNKDNSWVKNVQQSLHMPVVAGPSGTMLRMFQMWEYLKKPVKGEDFRLAVLAWMLVGNDHSFHEMMLTASNYGMPYTPGQKSYRNIAPLSEEELRKNVAVGGLFPDEQPHFRLMKDNKFNLVTKGQKETLEDLVDDGDLPDDLSEQQKMSVIALLSYTDEDPSSYKFMNNMGGPLQSLKYKKFIKEDGKLSDKYEQGKFKVDDIKKEASSLTPLATAALDLLPRNTSKTYRGFKAFFLHKAGSTISDKKFFSTSTDRGVAEGFANKGVGPKKVVAEITSHSGRELGNVSMIAGEGEVLFKPGTQFKVLPGSGKQASDGYYVENWQETGEPPKQKEDDEKMPPLKFITGNLAGGLPVSSGGLDTESDEETTNVEQEAPVKKLILYYDSFGTGEYHEWGEATGELYESGQTDGEWVELISEGQFLWAKADEYAAYTGKVVPKVDDTPVKVEDKIEPTIVEDDPGALNLGQEAINLLEAGASLDMVTFSSSGYDTEFFKLLNPQQIEKLAKIMGQSVEDVTQEIAEL